MQRDEQKKVKVYGSVYQNASFDEYFLIVIVCVLNSNYKMIHKNNFFNKIFPPVENFILYI